MAQYKLVIAEKPSVAHSLAAVIGATARTVPSLRAAKCSIIKSNKEFFLEQGHYITKNYIYSG